MWEWNAVLFAAKLPRDWTCIWAYTDGNHTHQKPCRRFRPATWKLLLEVLNDENEACQYEYRNSGPAIISRRQAAKRKPTVAIFRHVCYWSTSGFINWNTGQSDGACP